MKKLIVFLLLISSVFGVNKYLLNVNSYNIDGILSYDTLEQNIDEINIFLEENSYKKINIVSLEEKINTKVSDVLKGMKFYDRIKAFIYFNFIYEPIEYKNIDVKKYAKYIGSLSDREKETYIGILKKELKSYERN